MLIDEIIDVKITSTNIEHYISKGHQCELGKIIKIHTADLSPTSKKEERRICDCKCENCTINKEYIRQHNFNIVTFNSYGKDVNPQCLKLDCFKKLRRQKVENTNLEKYGVKAPLQNEKIHAKQKQTMKNRYGVEAPACSTIIMNKVKETNIKKYNGTTPMASTDIREKVRKTLYKNGKVPTSSQQKELENMLKEYFQDKADIILNYPESTTSLDIAFLYKEAKVDIEYDAWYWHKDKQKDRKRDEFLKGRGYKILRIRSGHLLPDLSQVLEALNFLIEQNHSFTEIILSDWVN